MRTRNEINAECYDAIKDKNSTQWLIDEFNCRDMPYAIADHEDARLHGT